MAAPKDAHVLLETVALGADEGAASAGAGGEQAAGDPDEYQQQELLTFIEDESDANGDDQRLAERRGLGQYPGALDASARLRLMTTRAPSP